MSQMSHRYGLGVRDKPGRLRGRVTHRVDAFDKNRHRLAAPLAMV
jgi:hypothetical protein